MGFLSRKEKIQVVLGFCLFAVAIILCLIAGI